MIRSYSAQLIELASQRGVPLLKAFRHAGIPDSTYYRSITGPRSLSWSLAQRIEDAIEWLHNHP